VLFAHISPTLIPLVSFLFSRFCLARFDVVFDVGGLYDLGVVVSFFLGVYLLIFRIVEAKIYFSA